MKLLSIYCLLLGLLSLSTHRSKLKEELPKDTIDTIVYTHRDTLLLQSDSLLEWAKVEKTAMPNTTNYIRSLMDSVDIKDSTSINELSQIATVLTGIDNLSSILLDVQQLNEVMRVTAEAISVVDTLYNQDDVKRLQREIDKLDIKILTDQQKEVIKEIYSQLDKYYLATSNFLGVIDDLEDAKSTASAFTNRINEDVLYFENRNKNINRIPYMRRKYEELKSYFNQLPDGTFDVEKVQWEKIEKLKTTIVNCRKK